MSDHPFLRFINLVSFDQKIQFFENEKNSIDETINTLQKQKEEQLHTIEDMKANVSFLKKKVDEQELEMKILDQKEKEKKQRLENVSDYRDYQAIKVEVEAIQRLQIEQEKVVLDAWNNLENAQLLLQKKIAEHEKESEHLYKTQEELEKKSAHLNQEIISFNAQRAEKEEAIPAEWLEKYTIMRARVADPVVEIFHQSCGACSQTITNQDMVRARRGALVQCQKCYRLLYSPEAMERHDE